MINKRLLLSLAIACSPILMGISPAQALDESAPDSASLLAASLSPYDQPPVPYAVAETTLGHANTSRVRIEGQVVLVFDEDNGAIAQSVAERLNALHDSGELAAQRLHAVQRGDRYAVNVGSTELISFGAHFARIQDVAPAKLAQRYVQQLQVTLEAAARVAAVPSAPKPVAPKPAALKLVAPAKVALGDPALAVMPAASRVAATPPADRGTCTLGPVAAAPLTIRLLGRGDLGGRDAALAVLDSAGTKTAQASLVPEQPRVLDRSDRSALLDRSERAPAGQRALMRLVSRGGYTRRGSLVAVASWYGGWFHGRRAADGSRFNQNEFTAAHKTLPFGTVLKVTNLKTKRSALVKVTDRGPYIPGRSLDLSRAAADAIGMLHSGVGKVQITVYKRPKAEAQN